MKNRDIRDYLQDILDSIREVKEFIENMEFEDFAEDKKSINAVVRSLEVIGEAAKKIPDNLREKYPQIPWKRMAGMRDKLIHEYWGVDLEIVWEVINSELPPISPLIQKVLGDMEERL
ncbi:MAG: DUF86 domain-containing protein [bacterium]|nr:DUF86 domain-containing protein [bacterium]